MDSSHSDLSSSATTTSSPVSSAMAESTTATAAAPQSAASDPTPPIHSASSSSSPSLAPSKVVEQSHGNGSSGANILHGSEAVGSSSGAQTAAAMESASPPSHSLPSAAPSSSSSLPPAATSASSSSSSSAAVTSAAPSPDSSSSSSSSDSSHVAVHASPLVQEMRETELAAPSSAADHEQQENDVSESGQQDLLMRHQQAHLANLARAGLMHPHAHPYHAAAAMGVAPAATAASFPHHFAASHPYASFPGHQFLHHFHGAQHLQHPHAAAGMYSMHSEDPAAAANPANTAQRHPNLRYPAEMPVGAMTGNFPANYAHLMDEHSAAAAAALQQRYGVHAVAALPQMHHMVAPHLSGRRGSGDMLMGDGRLISSASSGAHHPHQHPHAHLAFEDPAVAYSLYNYHNAHRVADAAFQSHQLAAMSAASSAADKSKKAKPRKKKKEKNGIEKDKDGKGAEQSGDDGDEEERRKAAKDKKKKQKEKPKEKKIADSTLPANANPDLAASAAVSAFAVTGDAAAGLAVDDSGRKPEKKREKDGEAKAKDRKKAKEPKKEREKKEKKPKEKPKALHLPAQHPAASPHSQSLPALPSPGPEMQSASSIPLPEGESSADVDHAAHNAMDVEPALSPGVDDQPKSDADGAAFASTAELTQANESGAPAKKGKKGRKPGSTNKRKSVTAAPQCAAVSGPSQAYYPDGSGASEVNPYGVDQAAFPRNFSFGSEGQRHTRQTHAAFIAESSESQQERLLHSVFRSLPTNPTRRSRQTHFQQNASAHKRKIVHFKMKAPEISEERLFVIKEAVRQRRESQSNGTAKNDALIQFLAEKKLKEEKHKMQQAQSKTETDATSLPKSSLDAVPVSSVISPPSLSLLQLNMSHLTRMIELEKEKSRVQQEAFEKDREHQRKERQEENLRRQLNANKQKGSEKKEKTDAMDEELEAGKDAEEEGKKQEVGLTKRRGRRRKADQEEEKAQNAKRLKTEESDGKGKRGQDSKEEDADADGKEDEKEEDAMMLEEGEGEENKDSESSSAVAKHPHLLALEEKEKVMRQRLSEKHALFKDTEENLKKNMAAKQKLFTALKNILSSEAQKKKSAPPLKDVKKPATAPSSNTVNTTSTAAAASASAAAAAAAARSKMNFLKEERPSLQWMKPVFHGNARPEAASGFAAASPPPRAGQLPPHAAASPQQLFAATSPSMNSSSLLSSPTHRQIDRRLSPSPAQSPGVAHHPLVRPVGFPSMAASQLPPPPSGSHHLLERDRERELDRARERDAFARFHPPQPQPVSSPPQPPFQARPRMWSAPPPPSAPGASPPQPPQMQSPHRPMPPMARQGLGPSPSTPSATTPGFSPLVAPLPSPVLNSSHALHPPAHTGFADHRERFDLDSTAGAAARPPPPQPPLPPQQGVPAGFHSHVYRDRDRPDTAPPLPPHPGAPQQSRPPPPPGAPNYGERYPGQNQSLVDYARAQNPNFRNANLHPPPPPPPSGAMNPSQPSPQSGAGWHHAPNYGNYPRNPPPSGAPPPASGPYPGAVNPLQYDRDRPRYEKRFPSDGPPMYPPDAQLREREGAYGGPMNMREREVPPMLRDMREREREMRPMHPGLTSPPPPSHPGAYYRGPPPPPHPGHPLSQHPNRPPPPPPPPPHPGAQQPPYRSDGGNWH